MCKRTNELRTQVLTHLNIAHIGCASAGLETAERACGAVIAGSGDQILANNDLRVGHVMLLLRIGKIGGAVTLHDHTPVLFVEP